MECDKLIVVYIKGYALVGLLWNVFEENSSEEGEDNVEVV